MTSPLAIIAGVPLGPYRRSQWNPERPGWVIQVIPSKHIRRADLKAVWSRVMDAADNAPPAGAHLLLLHDHEQGRRQFKDLKTKSYRATWLPRQLSRQYGSNQFRTAVERVLYFEESWRDRVRPGIDSPLLLPETAFSTEPSVGDVWLRAGRVDEHRDHLDAVEKAIVRFRKRHRKPDGWHDNKRLVFKHGTPHGGLRLPEWRKRKLTCEFPSGFHFDVRHSQGRPFRLASQERTVHEYAVYANVDPHGFFRGGH